MPREYVHAPTAAEAIAGSLEVEMELEMGHGGRDLLVVVGKALVDTACCGVTGMRYAVVPGYILRWQHRTDGEGHPVSEVEPVLDLAEQRAISRAVKERHRVSQVVYW